MPGIKCLPFTISHSTNKHLFGGITVHSTSKEGKGKRNETKGGFENSRDGAFFLTQPEVLGGLNSNYNFESDDDDESSIENVKGFNRHE